MYYYDNTSINVTVKYLTLVVIVIIGLAIENN